MNKIRIDEYTDNDFPAAESFLQSRFWANFKQLHGWTYRQYTVKTETDKPFLLTVLLRRIKPFGIIGYIPLGPAVLTELDSTKPETASQRGNFLTALAEQLKALLPEDVFLVRFDPPWETAYTASNKNELETFPLFPSISKNDVQDNPAQKPLSIVDPPSDIQPPDTVILDLTKPTDTLLSECKSKWRYNIRLAEKKGVTVHCFSGGAAEKGITYFYDLYRETAERDGIAIHHEEYYRSLCRLSCSSTENPEKICIAVYTAFFEEEPLAAIIVLFSEKQAVYLYGASSNKKRNLMPAYLLQWKALCDAKTAGCSTYDFYGIPPSDDPNHPMHGLYRFKTGFGGTIIHRVGSVDIPVKSLRSSMYYTAERLRSFWFKNIKKKHRKQQKPKS